jgi:hypothetical protein
LGDTIAHIVKLGDMGWSTISARRARSHLVEIYKLVERLALMRFFPESPLGLTDSFMSQEK